MCLHLPPNFTFVSSEGDGKTVLCLSPALPESKPSLLPWVKVQHFKNPELSKFKSLKLAVCLQSVNNFKLKWSIVQIRTENKSEKLLKSA